MIREATPNDVPAILELVRQLAAFEREPDAAQATAEQFHASFFGETPLAHALVADVDGDVVGCAIWFVSFSTWTGRHGIYLEDLIVDEQHRGGGHGFALLNSLARICVERNYTRLEWTVLDWNEKAISFYDQLGAIPMSDWTARRLDGESLAAVASSRG